MITIAVDPHTHTLFSGHAFSTIGENAAEAAKRGLAAIGMTDHLSPLFTPKRANGMPDYGPMMNMAALPSHVHGVRVLAGVEIDIVDHDGHLYLYDRPQQNDSELMHLLRTREIAIASVHWFEGSAQGSVAQNTRMYVNAIQTPGIHALGHIGRTGLPFDIDTVLIAARDAGKMIEINEHSFDFGEVVIARCTEIAQRCAALGVSIMVGSDAHSAFTVGIFDRALAMLAQIGFPPELVANRTLETFLDIIGCGDGNQR